MTNLTYLHARSGGRMELCSVHGVCSATCSGEMSVSGGCRATCNLALASDELGGLRRARNSVLVTGFALELGFAGDEDED